MGGKCPNLRKCVKMRREGKACLVRPAEDTGLGKAGRGTSGKRWGLNVCQGFGCFFFLIYFFLFFFFFSGLDVWI